MERTSFREPVAGRVAFVALAVVLAFIMLLSACAVDRCIEAKDASLHEMEGHWEGAINVMGQELIIRVDFAVCDGTLSGTIDIPQQGALGLPLANIKLESPNIHFELPVPNARADFDGVLAGDEISGDFLQSGVKGSFSIKRTVSEATGTTADDPKISSIGKSEDVLLETSTGKIHGTLQLPEAPEMCPVVLIIAGSGPTDRDGNSPLVPGKNDSLKMIAQGLAENGIASVRYDKRGIGESTGAMFGKSEADLRFDHYVDDAVAWIERLKADPRFSGVVVLGHSEGSLIGIAAANKVSSGLSGVISVAGAGKPAYELITEQLANEAKEIRDESHGIMEELKKGNEVANVSLELMPLFRPSVQPYLISWFEYDPAAEIGNLDVPVLILQGTTDLQVSCEDAKLLAKAKPDAKLKIIDGMNHVLKEAPIDYGENLATYGNPTLPLAPGFLEEIISFVKECVK
ncbi:MAG TPA: alpha/beta fold hydrolase [Bacillota bacterium]|nr:alpha/beta fold hydrolase [Bacillota bacterium]